MMRFASEQRALDQFYTLPNVAQFCVNSLSDFLGSQYDNHVWIEPAAGTGQFLKCFPSSSVALDIAPSAKGIKRANFLEWKPERGTRSIVVGNPPFGKNASLAQRFFNHAAAFSDVIAFILPRTFQKQTLTDRLDPQMHLRAEFALPEFAFTFEGAPYDVPTIFQIWQKSEERRKIINRPLTHPHFEFVNALCADFAFQRVGARAGLVSQEGLSKSPQSHYFLKAQSSAKRLFQELSGIDWSHVKSQTAGNPSIGKRELIEQYQHQSA